MADPLLRPAETASPTRVSRRILLADASPRTTRITHQILYDGGFDVVVCRDGETVLRKANTQDLVAIVLDPELRGIHGLEILARLRRQPHPVPVLLTSRNERLREDFIVKTYPGLVYLRKPYDRRELNAALNSCLETRQDDPAAIGPDEDFLRAIPQGPTVGILRTPVLEIGICARGSFRDTIFRLLPIDERRSGLFVAEREVGPEDTGTTFRQLGRALDEAVREGSPPADVLRRVHRSLLESSAGTLLAALALEMDAASRDFVLCRAGFHAPLAATPGGSPAEVHLPFGSLLGHSPTEGASRPLRTVRLPFPEDGALLLRSTGALLALSQVIPDLGHRLFSGYLREHAGSAMPSALESLLGVLGALGVQGPGRDLLLVLVRRRNTGAHGVSTRGQKTAP